MTTSGTIIRRPLPLHNIAVRLCRCMAVLVLSLCVLCISDGNAQDGTAGPLRVRGDHNYPPYEFLQNGKPTGYNVDMMRAVARVMDLDIEIELGPWSEVREDLEAGRAEIITGMYRSEERDEKVDFSQPHIIVHHSLFVHRGSGIESLEDMAGRSVVVQEGDIMHDFALREGIAQTVVTVSSPLDALTLLDSGNYEAALLGRLQGIYLAQREGLKHVEAVGPTMVPRQYCFAVGEGRRELLARLDEGLRVLSATGEADEIYDKWFGPASGTPHPWRNMLPYAVGLAALAFGGLLGVILWSRMLSQKVKDATERLQEELKERRRAERELAHHRDHLEEIVEERTQELREANQQMLKQERLATLGQLTATVSHELRNPLGTIRNSAYTVREHMRRTGIKAPEAALERIERSLLRCDSIIQELLEYTRARNLSPGPTDLDPWLERIAAEFNTPPGVELRLDLRAGVQVMIDTDRFRRVIVNLVDNAAQAITGARGDVSEQRPRPGIITLSSRTAGDRVEVEVSDNGPGIPPEVAQRIFEPLYTTKSYGVGLGLPIVHQVMHLHGGDVELETEPGRGTTFTVWVPNGPAPDSD